MLSPRRRQPVPSPVVAFRDHWNVPSLSPIDPIEFPKEGPARVWVAASAFPGGICLSHLARGVEDEGGRCGLVTPNFHWWHDVATFGSPWERRKGEEQSSSPFPPVGPSKLLQEKHPMATAVAKPNGLRAAPTFQCSDEPGPLLLVFLA